MRLTRILPVIAMVVAVLTGPTAGHAHAGAGGGGAVCDGFAEGDEVTMLDSCFAGTAQLVDTDASVLDIDNQGRLPHTFTAIDGSFDLYLDAGEHGTVDLPADAVIPVYCTLHGTRSGQGMSGVVVRTGADVVGASATEVAAPVPGAALDADVAGTPASNGGAPISVIALVVAAAAAALSVATAVQLTIARRAADA